jgi:hypothetical protein
MKPFLLVVLTLLLPGALQADSLIKAKDADGVVRNLNPAGQVTVIVYSNPEVQDRTRQTGRALDPFQGREDFRSIVVVDLRGTMADWAPGYTIRRMVKDLDQEALRVTPAYREKGNKTNPRPDLSAVADFKGETCLQLGWEKPVNQLRVLIFDKKGKKYREWGDLKNFNELAHAVQALLNS